MEPRVLAVLPVGRERIAAGAREERPAVLVVRALQHLQQLRIDAAHRPHVDLLVVVVLHMKEHNFFM